MSTEKVLIGNKYALFEDRNERELEQRTLERRFRNDSFRREYAKHMWWCVIISIGVSVLTMFGYTLFLLNHTRNGQPIPNSHLADQTGNSEREYAISIATQQGNTWQNCNGSHFKQTFPDIGYALMGYNVFKGYPQATGHDPGFTFPIFKADYSENTFSADCQDFVPKGLIVLPDMSCVTSFSSKTVKTERDFSESLHQSAYVSGSVWGVDFSLSDDYDRTVSEVSNGKYIYILSSATCSYYSSKLVKGILHSFDQTFIKWAQRLNTATDEQTYFDFFNTYGTHFPVEVTIGARYIFQNKITSEYYQRKTESGVDMAAAANFAGEISFGINVTEKQAQMASDFTNNVEKETITVGAPPPANGDAMTWASTVKDNPLPSFYSLESIENLFSEDYMANLNLNLTGISAAILEHKSKYCTSLASKENPNVCNSSINGLVFRNTNIYIYNPGFYEMGLSFQDCIDYCSKEPFCLALNYCNGCNASDSEYGTCYMVVPESGPLDYVKEDFKWISVFYTMKLTESMMLRNTSIIGSIRSNALKIDRTNHKDPTECFLECLKDPFCDAYSEFDICRLFKAEDIIKFEKTENATSYIMPDKRERLNGESLFPLKHELSKYLREKQTQDNIRMV